MIEDCPEIRKLSFSQEPDHEPGGALAGVGTLLLASDLLANEEWQGEQVPNGGITASAPALEKPELTCISEEGIADMDLPDNIFDEYDYIGDCITSCNKVSTTFDLFPIISRIKNPFLPPLGRKILDSKRIRE